LGLSWWEAVCRCGVDVTAVAVADGGGGVETEEAEHSGAFSVFPVTMGEGVAEEEGGGVAAAKMILAAFFAGEDVGACGTTVGSLLKR
jgi:hypothetical protein